MTDTINDALRELVASIRVCPMGRLESDSRFRDAYDNARLVVRDMDLLPRNPSGQFISLPPRRLVAAVETALGRVIELHKSVDGHWYWKPEPCGDCKGTGVYAGLGAPETCKTCDGRKKLRGGSIHHGCSGYTGWFIHGAGRVRQDGRGMALWKPERPKVLVPYD